MSQESRSQEWETSQGAESLLGGERNSLRGVRQFDANLPTTVTAALGDVVPFEGGASSEFHQIEVGVAVCLITIF